VPGRGRALLVAFLVYGLAALGAVLAPRQGMAMALLCAAGWSLVTAFSTLNSLVQENAPDAFRGRVLSIYGLAFRGGMPLGSLLAGLAVGRWAWPSSSAPRPSCSSRSPRACSSAARACAPSSSGRSASP
jgi:MFS family permease